MTLWQGWMPGDLATGVSPAGSTPSATTGAFMFPLPDGRYPRFDPPRTRISWFPVDPIEADVSSVDGPDASPVTLSPSELLFAYVRWPGYLAVADTSAGATTQWFSRYAALAGLARVTSPAAFAERSAHTAFGPIDVFILHNAGSRWTWASKGSVPEKTVSFTPAQFEPRRFHRFHQPPRPHRCRGPATVAEAASRRAAGLGGGSGAIVGHMGDGSGAAGLDVDLPPPGAMQPAGEAAAGMGALA